MKKILIAIALMLFISCESPKKFNWDELLGGDEDVTDVDTTPDQDFVVDEDTAVNTDSDSVIIPDSDVIIDNDVADIDNFIDDDAQIDSDSNDIDELTDADADSDADSDIDADIVIEPFCGDGTEDLGEVCDKAKTYTKDALCDKKNGARNYYEAESTSTCNSDCQGVSGNCYYCGDGIETGANELGTGCDYGKAYTADKLCDKKLGARDYYSASTASCSASCAITGNCYYCGDGVVSNGEVCDGNTTTCSNAGVTGSTGTATCRSDCSGWVTFPSKCTRSSQTCTGLPGNAIWNTASNITQTWTGTDWTPTTAGVYNTSSSTTQCRYKCDTNYTWDTGSSTCKPSTRTQSCSGLPSSASWNTVSYIDQTWSGSVWLPTEIGAHNTEGSTTECRFKCNTNYTWNPISETCVADTKSDQACSGLPVNAFWNEASSITQTWNGSAWLPSTVGVQNATPSTIECRFKCNDNYTWNSGSSTCVANTRTNQACIGLPANAAWNTATNISQTWNGGDWAPTTTGAYNTSVSTTECRFKCNTNYTWNVGTLQCVADVKANQACTGLPTNAAWNTATNITQTWSGSAWLPTTVGVQNTSVSTTECRFKCNTNYTWNSGSSTCVADVKTNQACTGLPTNAAWNTATNISQTWSGSAWLPTTVGVHNTTLSTTECRFKCNTNYTSWDNSTCISIFKQWGTSSWDVGQSVAVDSSGNIFVAGDTGGSFDGNTNAGGSDIFLTKWNSDGTKAWTKQWGTSLEDSGRSIAIDSSGNIFVAGDTDGSLDENTNAGGRDLFLTKWNSDGTKAWTKQWGTNLTDIGFSVSVDSLGNIFIAGRTSGSLDGNINAGEVDMFLTKWNSDGTKAWTKQWGTSGSDSGQSVTIDGSDNIFVTGYTYGSLDGNANAGEMDVFLTKWNSNGTKQWTKQWGTGLNDWVQSIAVDSSGNIFVAGYTNGSLDGNAGAGEWDVFLTRLNSNGVKAWTKQWGTSTGDYGTSVAVDGDGNIFVTGYTPGSLDGNTNAGSYDIFLTKWNANGTKAWTKQWGTDKDERGHSVAVDNSGNIFVAGEAGGSLDGNISAGWIDIFLTKWIAE